MLVQSLENDQRANVSQVRQGQHICCCHVECYHGRHRHILRRAGYCRSASEHEHWRGAEVETAVNEAPH